MRLAGVTVAVSLLLSAAALAAGPEPGTVIEVRPQSLPRPNATPSAALPPVEVARPAGATLRLPEGFKAQLYAEGLRHARWLAVAPNGDVFVAESSPGRITLLRGAGPDGKAAERHLFSGDFDHPHGMAFQGGFLYVADVDGVWRLAYQDGQTKASGPPQRVTPRGALGGSYGHWTRSLVFAPDGRHFYVGIGSEGNIAEEALPRAAIMRFDADGSNRQVFASGLRNPVGLAWRPGTRELWATVNERDGMGDGLVPDYLAHVEEGDFFGWPYAYIGPNPQPGLAEKRPDLVAAAKLPDILFGAHSAPLGLVFYDGGQFPPDYRGDAFVALHGSWNTAEPVGYMVVRVRFDQGRAGPGYEVFATGFRVGPDAPARVWGRPVGLAVAGDGALLVADDAGQTVWRIVYDDQEEGCSCRQ